MKRFEGERIEVGHGDLVCGYCCNHCPDRDCNGRSQICRREHADGFCAAPEV